MKTRSRFNLSLFASMGVALSLCFASPLIAQPFQKQVYSIPVTGHGVQIEHPFTGGFMDPVHQFVDLDGDLDLDLVVYDFNDNSLAVYRNQGTRQQPLFRFEQPWFNVPATRSWFRFVDVDRDGKVDFLSDGDSANSIAIYKNTGTPQAPQFTLFTSLLRDSAGVPVFAPTYCVAAFIDIDGDGNLDYFSLNPCCGTINYYRNTGTSGNLRLSFRTDRYQNIVICPGCGGIPGGPASTISDARLPKGLRSAIASHDYDLHGLGDLHFADVDHDRDFDLFYGDLNEPGILFYKNIGTPTNAVFDSIGRFPPSSPILTAGFNQPSFVDIDADGDPDLFVSVVFFDQTTDNFWFARNVGDSVNYSFALQTKNYLTTVDVGRYSVPAFADIDNDGKKDMFIGDLSGRLAYYKNVGSPIAPAFALVDSAYISSTTRFAYAPTFADIDGDGDLDLFLGHFEGNVEFYKNIGSLSSPQFQRQVSFFDSLNVGTFAAPTFVDIDSDGDLDLFVGESNGRIFFYRNISTPPGLSFTLVTTSFQNIVVGNNAKPHFADVDGDGDLDLIIGTSDGKIYMYRNNGPPSNPVFTFVTDAFGGISPLREVAPVLVDIDNDGDADLFVGNTKGGLEFYRNQRISQSVKWGRSDFPMAMTLGQNYPNPFNPQTRIEFRLPAGQAGVSRLEFVSLKVYDILGRQVATLVNEAKPPGSYEVTWDATALASGIYVYRLEAGGRIDAKKLVLMK